MAIDPAATRAILIACIALASLAVGFTMPLVAISLETDGLSSTLIGLNAAAPALGILTVTLFTRILVSWLGVRSAMFGSAVLFVGLILLLPHWRGFWPWFLVRYLIGLCTGLFWVVAEAWLNAITPNSIRGRIFGAYSALGAVGLALGPLLIMVWGTNGDAPFQMVAVIFTCAAIAVCLLPTPSVRIASVRSLGYFTVMKYAPRATLAAIVAGFLVTVQIVLVPIYAARVNLSADTGAAMLAAVLTGAVLIQPIVGWMADKLGRERILVLSAIAATVSAAVLWLEDSSFAHWVLLAVWGGTAAALYSVSLIMIGDQFEIQSLAAAGAALHGAYHFGNIVGPAVVGVAMDRFGPSALMTVSGIVSGAFVAAVSLRRLSGPVGKRTHLPVGLPQHPNSAPGKRQHED